MLVSFNPAVSSRSYSNNKEYKPAFGNVNQGWLEKIINKPSVAYNDFRFELLASDVSKTDYIDTLSVAKTRVGEGFKKCIEDTIDWATKFQPRRG